MTKLMRPIRKAVGKFRSLTAEHQGPLAVAAMASYEAEWHQAHGYDLVIRHLGAERNVFNDAEFQVGLKCEWGGEGGVPCFGSTCWVGNRLGKGGRWWCYYYYYYYYFF